MDTKVLISVKKKNAKRPKFLSEATPRACFRKKYSGSYPLRNCARYMELGVRNSIILSNFALRI